MLASVSASMWQLWGSGARRPLDQTALAERRHLAEAMRLKQEVAVLLRALLEGSDQAMEERMLRVKGCVVGSAYDYCQFSDWCMALATGLRDCWAYYPW